MSNTISGKTTKKAGAASATPFRVAKDGDQMPGTGQRLTTGQTSDTEVHSWVSANDDSTYTLTVPGGELRGTLTSIPLKAGAWQRIPGATVVLCVDGDICVWDAREV